jgi:hypothetical protein
MGASWFRETAYGKSLRDAYNNACQDAEEYAGHQDGYNGTISTTHHCEDLTTQYKRSKKSLQEYIDMQMDKIQKWHCGAICIEEPKDNTNKTKSQVEHIVIPGTKKWVLQYAIETYDGNFLSAHATKTDAVRIARYHTEKTQQATKIKMRKMIEKGDPLVARITYKKSLTEKPGKYILFGWAAE